MSMETPMTRRPSSRRVASRHIEAKYDKYAPKDARGVLSTHLFMKPGNPDPELDVDVQGQNTPWAPLLQRARQWSLPEFTEHMEQYAFNENIEELERELAEEPLLYRVVQNGKTRARGNTSEEGYRSGNLRERIEDYHKYDRWMQKGGPWEIVVKPRPKSDYRKLDALKKMRVVREKEWADLYKRLRSTDSAEIVGTKNSANGIQFLVQNHNVFVGGISAASAGTSNESGRGPLISNDCWKDIRTLAEEHGDGTVWTVVSSTLWPEYRRKGLGTKLYESVIHALRSKPGGPYYLIPHGCWGGMGNTSPDARRVWKKLWSRYPSSGDVLVVGG
jgi:ribosomal protein S18 acetylase RimI-like enzyme